jgi:hypothetical protein
MNISDKPHFAIICTESVFIPGDERSRQNPGHGYPDETREYSVYKPFDTIEQMTSWIKMYGKNKKYTAIKSTPLQVSVVETIEIKE